MVKKDIETVALTIKDEVAAILADAAGDTVYEAEPLVRIRETQHGPIAGSKILFSPHRAEIDRMLFVEGLPYVGVVKACQERFGLNISRKSLARYATMHRDSELRHSLAVPSSVVMSEIEQDFRASRDVIRSLKEQAADLIRRKQFKMSDVIKAINLEFTHFKPDIMASLLDAEDKYRKALAAVMGAVQVHADQDTRNAIQAYLMSNEDFIAAMKLDNIVMDE